MQFRVKLREIRIFSKFRVSYFHDDICKDVKDDEEC